MILLSVLVALVACTSEKPSEEATQANEKTALYASWRTGQFYYKVSPFGVFLVNRTDTLQEEYIRANRMLTAFKIAWQNDSMYTLRFHKLAENPQGQSLPGGIDSLVKVCTMTNVSDTLYEEKALSNMSGSYIYTTYRRPKQTSTDNAIIWK